MIGGGRHQRSENDVASGRSNGVAFVRFRPVERAGGTLTEKDLKSENDKGETFVQACFKMKQVETLMRPDVYGNAKDYQAAYDALPEAGKKGLDGCDGRPGFLKMKNQIMAAAVKKALAGKTAAGRAYPLTAGRVTLRQSA